MNTPKTLFDKIWGDHVISQTNKNQYLLYIDRHLVHEVTSPQAFEGLKLNKRKVRKPELTLGVADHNVPTTLRDQGINSIKDKIAKLQVETLEKNLSDNNIKYIRSIAPHANPNKLLIKLFEESLGTKGQIAKSYKKYPYTKTYDCSSNFAPITLFNYEEMLKFK